MKVRTLRALLPAAVLSGLFLCCNAAFGTWLAAPRIDAAFFAAYAALAVASVRLDRSRGARGILPAGEFALLAFLGLFTLTTVARHYGYHFLDWGLADKTPSAALHCGMLRFLALTAILMPFLPPGAERRARSLPDALLPVAFVAGQALCTAALWRLTGGEAVWNDDNPSFLFRVEQFWRSFPHYENWVPFWNGGVVENVLASSGAAGYALMVSPLRLFSGLPHETQVAGFALLFVWLAPWTTFLAMRANRFPPRACWTAAMLSLFANRAFFLWTFHYGTTGFGLSSAFAPAAFLFLHAVAAKRLATLRNAAGLVFSMTLLCQWPPMGLVAVAATAAALSSWRRWAGDRRTVICLLVSAAVVVLLLSPAIRAVAGAKELFAYATSGREPAPWTELLLRALRDFRDSACDSSIKIHPLALVFGLAGFWTLPVRTLRRWFAVVVLVVCAAFAAGPELLPKMQLPRMAVATGMLAIVPAALRAELVWRRRRAGSSFAGAAVLALLLLGAWNAAKLYGGSGVYPFGPMPELVKDLAGWIRANVPEGSRVLFADRTGHAYGGGHIAYLPILTGREMIGCDYYAFPPGTFDPYCPPVASRSEPGGRHAFLVRHGASHMIAFERDTVEACLAAPDRLEEAATFHADGATETFHVFRVVGSRGVFLEGKGRVEADFNRLRVLLDGDPPERVVLAYNWNDRLEADPPARIAPFETGTSLGPVPGGGPRAVRFLEIRPGGAREIVVRYRPRF